MNTYDRNDIVRLRAEIRVEGVLTSPTTLTCSVMDPAGATLEYTAVEDSAGLWYADVDLGGSVAGVYHYRWEGDAPAQFGEEGEFKVRTTRFP